MADQDTVREGEDKTEETVAPEPSFVTNNFHAPIRVDVRIEINFPPVAGAKPMSPLEAFLGRNPFGEEADMSINIADMLSIIGGGSRLHRNCGNPHCPVCSSGAQSEDPPTAPTPDDDPASAEAIHGSDQAAAVAGSEDRVV